MKRAVKALVDDLDQVHQWIDIAFDRTQALPPSALEGRNHIMTGLYKLKRDLVAIEQHANLRPTSRKNPRRSIR